MRLARMLVKHLRCVKIYEKLDGGQTANLDKWDCFFNMHEQFDHLGYNIQVLSTMERAMVMELQIGPQVGGEQTIVE
jgi:hypothetical protein